MGAVAGPGWVDGVHGNTPRPSRPLIIRSLVPIKSSSWSEGTAPVSGVPVTVLLIVWLEFVDLEGGMFQRNPNKFM